MRFPKASIAAAFVAGCGLTAAAPTGCDGKDSVVSVSSSVQTPPVSIDGPEICGLEKLIKGVAISTDGCKTVNAVAVVALQSKAGVETVFAENGVCTSVDVEDATHISVSSTVPGLVKATVFKSVEDCEAKTGGTSVGTSVGHDVGYYFKPAKAINVGAVFVEVSVSASVHGLGVKTNTDVEVSSETNVEHELSVSATD